MGWRGVEGGGWEESEREGGLRRWCMTGSRGESLCS